jgi:hypothetical protein
MYISSMEQYFIYHIPNYVQPDGSQGKIGVSNNPDRRVKDQGYDYFEILEVHTDIDLVSIREHELQKEYGYPVDKSLYSQTIYCGLLGASIGGSSGSKESKSNGGKKGGKNKKTNIKACSKGGLVTRNLKDTCPYCGKVSTPAAMGMHKKKCARLQSH